MSGKDGRLGKEEHNRIYRELVFPNAELDSYTPQERPVAVVLAGQPGAGKGSLKRAVEAEFDHDIFVVDPDEQRALHPEAERWQKESPYGWSQKTNADAGGFAGSLRGEGVERRINLLVDTTLGSADGAIKTIRGLQEAGYQVEIRAVGAHELESRVGIDRRFTDGVDRQGVGRDVPLAFHDKVYADLPGNLDKVSAATGVRVRIYDRDDPANAVFDNQRDPGSPSAALREIRDGRLQAPETTQRMRIEAQEQADWHRDPQDRLVQLGKMEPDTLDALRRERVEANKPAISARDSEAWSTLDELVRDGAQPARAPLPGLELPPLGRAGATAGIAGIGLAAAAYDAKEAGERIGTAIDQDNLAAVRSEATHLSARSVGGAAAVFTPAAVGLGGGPAVALAVADAYLLTEAFDRGAQWLDKERIVHQTDRDGVGWEFTGRQWIREDLKADLRDDGVDQVRGQTFSALPDKARELSYLASVEAVSQAIGKADPRNPFELPANASDAPSDRRSPWHFEAQSGEWTRIRVEQVDPADPQSPNRLIPDTASPERAAELNRQASQIIDENIARGPAALAAQYEIGHKRNGYDQFGEVPMSVQTALNPNTLEASNGKQYVRDAQGQWSHESAAASPNHALELETTRERLLPALEQHRAQLATMPEWQPLTPEQQDRANLRQLYADHGVNPNPERFEAAYQAVKETREAQGINAAATSLALEPRPAGGYDINTPIQHLQMEGDGVVRVAATTTAADIQRVETTLKREPREIEVSSAQQRDEQAQTQREANRAGLSHDETQAAARMSVPPASAPGPRDGGTDEAQPAPVQEGRQERPGVTQLDNPAHQNHAMFAALLRTVNERDKELGRDPDEVSRQLAGGLVEKARERGLETIGAAKFTPDGTKVGMTDTADLSAPWAKTAVGDVRELAGQKLSQSSDNVAAINQQQALQQSLQPSPPTQGLDGPDGSAPRGPKLS
jgi:predicted ABC-type ATPase